MTTQKTNLYYAQKYLGMETLETRNSDSLDFHEVHVGNVVNMINELMEERGEKLNHPQLEVLIHGHLWSYHEGGLEERGSDSLDFHTVATWQIRKLLEDARTY